MPYKEFDIDYFRDVNDLVIDGHIKEIAHQYPFLGSIYKAWTKIEPNEGQDYEGLGREFIESIPDKRAELIANRQDPAIADHFVFMTVVGLIDNPHITREEKEAFFRGVFPPEEKDIK